ncbi:MAG: hypothetical protein K0S44_2894 [Bacteroidetes bacterium]|jgi:cytochrome c oxidase cbb3-type subunit 3|nr:hypothetical protein [Bacteroidota bacterium]
MINDIKTSKSAGSFRVIAAVFFAIFLNIQNVCASEIAVQKNSSIFLNPLFVGMSVVIVLLLIAIIALAELVKASTIAKRNRNNSGSGIAKSILLVLMFTSLPEILSAQNGTGINSAFNYWGLGSGTFYLMTAIIIFEILIAFALYSVARELLGINEKKRLAEEVKVKEPSFIEKINASVAIEKEGEIMLDHNYDGIHELDNDLPPWWKYGFYLTIVFSVIYMFYYHFSSGKLQLAEYEDEMLAGQYDVNEYKKKASNLVDENNATLLTDAVSLESGKSVYMDNCAACHGRAGEGGVGPNLTDDYWLHEGDIKGVFKTIKFGWPEKGMKSWQQDLSAKQIHEISSYVKSLRGTNPPNAKEKQGEIYSESNAVDTTNVPKKDSTQIALKGK